MSRRSVPLDRLASLPPGTQGLSAAQVDRQRRHGFNDIVAPATDGWLVVSLLTPEADFASGIEAIERQFTV